MKLLQTLLEMPLKGVSYHKSANPGSFSNTDSKIIHHNIKTKKYETAFQNVPDIYLYFVDHLKLKDIDGHKDDNYPEQDISFLLDDDIEIYPQFKPLIEVISIIKDKLEQEPKSSHFVVGDNYSKDFQIAPTPWIVIHRLLHAFLETGNITQIVSDTLHNFNHSTHKDSLRYFDEYKIFKPFLKMKSAINDKIASDELWNEIATEITITGHLRFDYQRFLEQFPHIKELQIRACINQIVDDVKDQVENRLPGKIFYI